MVLPFLQLVRNLDIYMYDISCTKMLKSILLAFLLVVCTYYSLHDYITVLRIDIFQVRVKYDQSDHFFTLFFVRLIARIFSLMKIGRA